MKKETFLQLKEGHKIASIFGTIGRIVSKRGDKVLVDWNDGKQSREDFTSCTILKDQIVFDYQEYINELIKAVDQSTNQDKIIDIANQVRSKFDGITDHDEAVIKEDLESVIEVTMRRAK